MNYIEEIASSIRLLIPEENLPEGESTDLLRGYAVLVRAKGTTATASDVHDVWSAWMSGQDPGHESIRPFDELDRETQLADEPFLAAIRLVASSRAADGLL